MAALVQELKIARVELDRLPGLVEGNPSRIFARNFFSVVAMPRGMLANFPSRFLVVVAVPAPTDQKTNMDAEEGGGRYFDAGQPSEGQDCVHPHLYGYCESTRQPM
jgi:hypothetical protein